MNGVARGGPFDLAALVSALARAEAEIGGMIGRRDPPIDDLALEAISIQPRLPDGRGIGGLRIGCEADGLTFRLTLLPEEAR